MGSARRVLFLVVASAWLAWGAPPRQAAPEFGAPDLLFFEAQVAPALDRRCGGCHSDAELCGGFRLLLYDDPGRPEAERLLANFRATLPFLDPERPAESRLLRKVLGAEAHGGGQIFPSQADAGYETLLHYAMGATGGNRPPEAIALKRYDTAAGTALELDATLSGDPEGAPLTYYWELAERPAGSGAALAEGEPGYASVTPDREGVYRVALSVHDGELWSLPATILIIAGAPAPPPVEPSVERRPPVVALPETRLDAARLRQIRSLYVDLTWRTPRLDEIAQAWNRSHDELVETLLDDAETWSAFFEAQLYYFLLLDRFRPKEGRVADLPSRLARREVTVPRALEEIVRSQYFAARNPGNDTFVTVVLEQCLGLVVQDRTNRRLLDAGKRMYDGYRATLFGTEGSSQADFVRIVFRQEGVARHLLARTWEDLHGAEADPKLLDPYVARLHADAASYPAILEDWLTGPAYVAAVGRARTKPEIPYVRTLFLDVLGRTPTYEELRNVRNAFLSLADPTPIRLVMGRVLLESDQARIPPSALAPERFVREQFVQLLGRPPTEAERAAFVGGLRNDTRVTPRLVLWALISSPEYQTY